ncbi:uncharacterized protein LOC124457543 isoform X2 [Xenia sp. Carnegie-2017]|nr:uncharacterized protein LOC124457543 isoform X2 [Xenia sp. Carnegie-2017]
MHYWIALLQLFCVLPIISNNYLAEIKNRLGRLSSHFILRNISTSSMHHCLHNCFEESSCLSFQICGTVCQLLSTNTNERSLEEDDQCIYFTTNMSSIRFMSKYCTESFKFSSYCFNNGTCQKSDAPYTETCNFCECKEGFVGKRCEKKAKSCQNFHGQSDGWYTIFTNENRMVKVFCQFDSVNVWTLVTSYSFKLRAQYRYQPYYKSFSRNEKNETLEDHRLSFNAMMSIKEDGNTLWRITCSYGDKDWNKTDLVVATHENAPILKQNNNGAVCLNVSFIDIKGYNCKDCSIPFWQDDAQIFHTDNTQHETMCNLKNFQSSVCSGGTGEDNFGFYVCYDTTHRCASSDNATTQLWFGQRMNSN